MDNLSSNASVWDYEVFWTEAVAHLRSEITEQEYQTWFSGMSYAGADDSQVRLYVPSSFYRDQGPMTRTCGCTSLPHSTGTR